QEGAATCQLAVLDEEMWQHASVAIDAVPAVERHFRAGGQCEKDQQQKKERTVACGLVTAAHGKLLLQCGWTAPSSGGGRCQLSRNSGLRQFFGREAQAVAGKGAWCAVPGQSRLRNCRTASSSRHAAVPSPGACR